MVAFMHTGTRLTAGYRYTTLGDATVGNRYVYFPVRPITASPIAQMRLLRCLRYSLALK